MCPARSIAVKVDKFSFGSIVVDGKRYHRDLLFFPDGTVQERKGGICIFGSHKIKREDIETLCLAEPEVVIVGLGTSSAAHLAPEVKRYASEAKMELDVLPSAKAVQRLNQLIEGGKKVAAIIHITC